MTPQPLLDYGIDTGLVRGITATEAERTAPALTIVEVPMIGAADRLSIGGSTKESRDASTDGER